VAEELFFGDVSTGPGGDLLYATNVAAEMTGSCGMGESLVSLAAIQNSSFSDTNIVGRVLGDPDGRARVEELLQRQKVVVRGLLDSNQHLVAALRDALVERHELIGKEITDVLEEAAAAAGTPQREVRAGGPGTIDLRAGRPARIDPPAKRRTTLGGCSPRDVRCCTSLPCSWAPRPGSWGRSSTRSAWPGCRWACSPRWCSPPRRSSPGGC
jgi:hypothetical protein